MPLSFKQSKHFLLRTGFGGTAYDIEQHMGLSRLDAIDLLFENTSRYPHTTEPQWLTESPPPARWRKSADETERKAFRQKLRKWLLELQTWWYRELIETPTPFTERMTLFWHNHFTSGFNKVRWPPFLLRQNLLLRKHALGNFAELLHAIAKDPAMIIYLDNISNNKNKPNENFARELLELFTLGEGHYSEKDIKEAARAFTGWKVNRERGEFRFAARRHDHGEKTFFGTTGNLNGEDIIDIILEQEQLAIHLTEKCWLAFISLQPDSNQIARVAGVFRESNYDINTLMREILILDHFWNEANFAALIKSPVEFIVGTLRLLNIHVHDLRPIIRQCRRLGQELFNPPNVKGWPGGNHWISSHTLLARHALTNQLLRGMDPHKHKRNDRKQMQMALAMNVDFLTPLTKGDVTPEKIVAVLLATSPVNPLPDHKNNNAFVFDVLQDPVYQLK